VITTKKLLIIGLLAAVPSFGACGDPKPADGGRADANNEDIDETQVQTRTKSFVVLDANRTGVPDSAVTLIRDPDAQTVTSTEWQVRELTPGDAVTAWWIFFTDQTDCEDGNSAIGSLCGPNDLRDHPTVQAGFGYSGPAPMGGTIVDENGDATFPTLTSPVITADSPINPDFLIGNGILDLMGTEVHLMVRSHGPALGGDLETLQLSSFDGGCLDGEPNAGLCKNRQFAFFAPLVHR